MEIRQVFRGKKSGIQPTEKQIEQIAELGLDLYKRTNKKSEGLNQSNESKENIQKAIEEQQKESEEQRRAREEEKQNRLQEAEEKRRIKAEQKKKRMEEIARKKKEEQRKRIEAEQARKKEKEELKRLKEEERARKREEQKRKKSEQQPKTIKSRINTAQDFISIMKKLQDNGISITEISSHDTFETLALKSGKGIEIIKELGFSPKYPIGRIKGSLFSAYKGRNKTHFPTPSKDEVEQLAELGIDLEESRLAKKFIKKMKLLQENGIDVSKITSVTTIGKLAKQSHKTDEYVRNIGLNPEEPIGYVLHNIRSAYREIGKNSKPSKMQIQQLIKLGISIENPPKGKDNSYDIQMLETLGKKGIYFFKTKKDETLKQYIERIGFALDNKEEYGDVPIDKIIKKLQNAFYRNKNSFSKEQLEVLEKIGINFEQDTLTRTERFIDLLNQLRDINVDVTQITMYGDFTIRKLAKKSGVDTTQLIEARIDPTICIGTMKKQIAGAYRGNNGHKNIPTQDQVQQLLEMGISLEKQRIFHGDDVGKAGFGTPVKICEAAQRDLKARTKEPNKGVI